MSSTNRSNARDLHVADYYVTPIDKIVDFIKEFLKYENKGFFRILDCCAGGSLNHKMSYPEAIHKVFNIIRHVDTIDIRQDSLADIKADYLTFPIKIKYDTIITNPPFLIAREIIEKAIEDVSDNGFVIMLLRLNFLEGKARKDFFDKYMPKYIFVHHRRMSFTDDGKTDSVAYAHFVWQKGYKPTFSQLKII